MADYSSEIAQLEAILNAGTSSVSVDGMSARYDLAEVRKRLAELKALDDMQRAMGRARPVASTIRLDYFGSGNT